MHQIQMDKEKFDNIYIKYYGPLCAFVYKYIHDTKIVEDIVQDVFCQLIEKNEDLHKETIGSFLYQSTHNRAINYLRSAHNRQDPIDSLDLYVDSLIVRQADEDYDYHRLLILFHKALMILPPKTRKVFLLSRKRNMSNKEIAAHLNVSLKSVEKHISKALSILRSKLLEKELILFFLFLFK